MLLILALLCIWKKSAITATLYKKSCIITRWVLVFRVAYMDKIVESHRISTILVYTVYLSWYCPASASVMTFLLYYRKQF